MFRSSVFTVIALALANCHRFVGEVSVHNTSAVAERGYVVLRPISSEKAPDSVAAQIYGRTVYFRPSERILDLGDLDPSSARIEGPLRGGAYAVGINTTAEGGRRFMRWTSTNIGNRVGVFLDSHLIAAPTIRSPIDDMIVLEGDFTKVEAETIVNRIHNGGLSR